jgi:DNA-binding MarR family transcriptional regulator
MVLANTGDDRMDYDDLAKEFIKNMHAIQAAGSKESIQDGFRGEVFVLHFIKKSQGKIAPGDISSAIGVSSARVATALNSLEDKGMITRRIDSEDRRKIIVELTPKGAEYVEDHKCKQIEKIKNILMSLGEEDSKEFVRLIGRLAEVLSKDPDTRCH